MERTRFESQLKHQNIYYLNGVKYRFIRRYQGWAHNRIGTIKIECFNLVTHQTVVDNYKPNRLWLEETRDNQFKYGK